MTIFFRDGDGKGGIGIEKKTLDGMEFMPETFYR